MYTGFILLHSEERSYVAVAKKHEMIELNLDSCRDVLRSYEEDKNALCIMTVIYF